MDWRAVFDRAAATREIGKAYVWFWILGFLFVLPLLCVACCLGGVLVIMEVWYLCYFVGFFSLFLFSLSTCSQKRVRAASLFVSPHAALHGGCHLEQRVFSAIFNFSLFTGSL